MSKRPPRSTAEWTTFGVSLLVLLVVLAAIGVQALRSDRPAAPAAVIDAVERRGDRFHVAVTVTNEGDETAEAIQVLVSLEASDETEEADQTVDFLAGGDERRLVFVFDEDPSAGELSVRIGGFLVP